MKPGATACGAWIRLMRDCWIASLESDATDEEKDDAACVAMDGIYGYMVAHGWMELDKGALEGPSLPLQPFPTTEWDDLHV